MSAPPTKPPAPVADRKLDLDDDPGAAPASPAPAMPSVKVARPRGEVLLGRAAALNNLQTIAPPGLDPCPRCGLRNIEGDDGICEACARDITQAGELKAAFDRVPFGESSLERVKRQDLSLRPQDAGRVVELSSEALPSPEFQRGQRVAVKVGPNQSRSGTILRGSGFDKNGSACWLVNVPGMGDIITPSTRITAIRDPVDLLEELREATDQLDALSDMLMREAKIDVEWVGAKSSTKWTAPPLSRRNLETMFRMVRAAARALLKGGIDP